MVKNKKANDGINGTFMFYLGLGILWLGIFATAGFGKDIIKTIIACFGLIMIFVGTYVSITFVHDLN